VSDVSAVVLSVGEPCVSRALESLSAQTYPLHEVLVIENVTPLYRALNEASRRVQAQFFAQVDADMMLDATCIEALRGGMDDTTGVVCAELRDDLMGQLVGVKLFRTACVRNVGFTDSVAQDTDFMISMKRTGWDLRYIGRHGDGRPADTFGEHRPDYTPAYTFHKFLREGTRYRYRGARGGLLSKMKRLDTSPHPLALFAQLVLAHGFFLTAENDIHTPTVQDSRAPWLADFLNSNARLPTSLDQPALHDGRARLRDVFDRFLNIGRESAAQGAGGTVKDVMARLKAHPSDEEALVARLAIGHGVLTTGSTQSGRDARAVRAFVCYGAGRRPSPREYLSARAGYLYKRFRRPHGARW
jgi:hypothetical protein